MSVTFDTDSFPLYTITFSLHLHFSGILNSPCCMKPATESEVLVLLILLAPILYSLTADRTTTSARDVDIVTTHEGNGHLANKFGGGRLIIERSRSATSDDCCWRIYFSRQRLSPSLLISLCCFRCSFRSLTMRFCTICHESLPIGIKCLIEVFFYTCILNLLPLSKIYWIRREKT